MKLFVINAEGFNDLIDWIMEPESFDELIVTNENWNLETLAVMAEIFKSKGLARSNGFCGQVPHGIFRIGTKKKRFWVWNPKLVIDIEHPAFNLKDFSSSVYLK